MLRPFRKYTIEDAPPTSLSIEQLRRVTNLLVVDDQGFEHDNALRNLGYSVKVYEDLVDIDHAAKFDIVVCDIRGVGTQFDPKAQGAFVALEIKRRYPDKFVAVFSSLNPTPKHHDLIHKIDGRFGKNWDINDWVSKLDDIARQLSDPKERWRRSRRALLDNGISIKTVAALENRYVRALQYGSIEKFQKYIEKRVPSDKYQGAIGICLGVIQLFLALATL